MLRNDLAGIMAGRRKCFVSILIAAQSRVSLASRPYRVLAGLDQNQEPGCASGDEGFRILGRVSGLKHSATRVSHRNQ
jgi:hypothetical protein